jgi:TonB family protein
MLLCGTTLAIARHAGGLLQGRNEPIMVTLVGKEGNSATDGELRKTPGDSPARSEQKNGMPLLEQALVKMPPVPDAELTHEGNGQPVQQQREGGSVPQERLGDDTGSTSDNGPAAGSSTGAVSSGQWAVIVSSIERVKSYPRLARERGIEGVVRLRFRVKPQGEVDRVEIVKSSGYEILDTASVRTVYRASPMPYVSGWVEVPIAYMLK